MPRLTTLLAVSFAGILLFSAARADPQVAPTPPSAKQASPHWAFVPPVRPLVPKVRNTEWVRTPVDAFIAAAHEARGLAPAAEAAPRVLVRRLYLDLLGLPPSPEEVQAFEKDPSAAAYARMVDRLLASPHYGERWGRHWLDLARWAESEGYESNHPRPYSWRYRDYVVQSFNCDKPYDRFLTEQIAGDELSPYSDENLIATGFLAAARLSSNEEDKAIQRNDVQVDVANATASVFLGVTLACAQCHNHKLEPFTQRDYYSFQGFFLKGQPGLYTLRDPELWRAYEASKPPEYEHVKKLRDVLFETTRARLIAQAKKDFSPETLQALDTPVEKRTLRQEQLAREADVKLQFTMNRVENNLSPEDKPLYAELKKKIEAMEKKMLDRPQTWAFFAPSTSPHQVEHLPSKGFYPLPYDVKLLAEAKPLLLRGGDVHKPGPALPIAWPAVFSPSSASVDPRRPRTSLANWLTQPDHPLTARVWVNRIWQYHFGRGIVATASDFGVHGARPTHPELLDWLARELVENSWSTKHIHRLILLSSTYRQSSLTHEANARIDPNNVYLWRWQPRRLEAEAIRDSILAVAGELDATVGGPSEPDDAKSNRRSLYINQRRDQAPLFQMLFDGPNAAAESCCKRHVTVTPLHALHLLNNPRVVELGEALARRVLKLEPADRLRQADAAMLLVVQRPLAASERAAVELFFKKQEQDQEGKPDQPAPALRLYCQVLLNLNEFSIIE